LITLFTVIFFIFLRHRHATFIDSDNTRRCSIIIRFRTVGP